MECLQCHHTWLTIRVIFQPVSYNHGLFEGNATNIKSTIFLKGNNIPLGESTIIQRFSKATEGLLLSSKPFLWRCISSGFLRIVVFSCLNLCHTPQVGLDLTFFTACNACLLFKTIYIYISTICSDPKIHRKIGNLIIAKDKSFIYWKPFSIFWAN